MSHLKQTFAKVERLFLQKEISCLYEQGLSFSIYPLRVIYLEKQIIGEIPISILVSVPKRYLKHAVKRSRIKRLIRESYRLTKSRLWEFLFIKKRRLLLAFIYINDKLCSYNQMETVMNKVLNILIEKMKCSN